MSQDTGITLTLLFGYTSFTRRPSHWRNRPVREAAGTYDETGMSGRHGRIAGPPGPTHPADLVIQTDRLSAAGTGQRGSQKRTLRAFPTRRAIRSTLLPNSGRLVLAYLYAVLDVYRCNGGPQF